MYTRLGFVYLVLSLLSIPIIKNEEVLYYAGMHYSYSDLMMGRLCESLTSS